MRSNGRGEKNREIIKGHPGNDEDLNQRDDGENGKVRSDGRGTAKEEDMEEIQGERNQDMPNVLLLIRVSRMNITLDILFQAEGQYGKANR